MRITIVNLFYPPDVSPTGPLVESLAEHRAAAGDEVTVVASKGGFLGGHVEDSAGPQTSLSPKIHVIRIWSPGLGKATKMRRLIDYAVFYFGTVIRLLLVRRQDLVICLTTPPFIGVAGVLHKKLHRNARLILWNMDCHPDIAEAAGVIKPGGIVSRVLASIQRFVLRNSDRIICLDSAMATRVASKFQSSPLAVPIDVLPNWEPVDALPESAVNRSRESQLNRPLRLIYTGNAGHGHEFETVLDAVNALDPATVQLTFIGGGVQHKAIAAYVRRHGMGNVEIAGYLERKEDVLQRLLAADCALVTLRDDCLGIMSPSKVHGYLSAGLSVLYVGPVGSNVDEAIVRGGVGASYRHGEVQEVTQFLRRMHEDTKYRQEMSYSARREFEVRYSNVAVLPRFDAIIDERAACPGVDEAETLLNDGRAAQREQAR